LTGGPTAVATLDAALLGQISQALREPKTMCYEGIAPSALYQVDDHQFGRGRFGSVYGIVDKNGVTWAVKDIPHPRSGEQIEVEVMLQGMPFNMALHEVYSTAMGLYLVMPMLSQRSLQVFATRRRDLMKKNLRSISAQIAFGAWELHQRGYMHLDLKPKNVMMLDAVGDNVTIIDYNMASAGCVDKRGRACDSRHAGLVGNGAWTAAMGRPYSYEVDWWSFGVLLCELALLKEPWQRAAWLPEGRPRYLNTSALEGADPSLVSLLNATIGLGYLSLKEPARRRAMESPLPEVHPILSHDFWLTGVEFTPATRTQALRDFWAEVCRSHAADPELQCAMLFRKKPAETRPACREAVVAKCCCRMSACSRNVTGAISELGVDEMLAVEGSSAKSAVCCARLLECGGERPHENTTVGGDAACD